jgi:nitrate reductase assembly molybdenum cofactor insertion protein NarJ
MTLAEQYAELSAQEKVIKAQKEELAIKILEHMKENQIGSIKADYGTFTKAQKLVYEYSEETKQKEAEMKSAIKEIKEAEEKTITPTISEYLIFRSK